MLRQILHNDGAKPASGLYRWGMLIIIVILIAWNIRIHFRYPSSTWHDLGQSLVCPAMLLFNHLAFAFRWPGLLGFAMNVLAFAWLIIGGYLVFFQP
jgi:hypothetical protein